LSQDFHLTYGTYRTQKNLLPCTGLLRTQGSDIILTNTFGANRPRLKLHNAESETYAINKAGAKIAGRVAENSEREIVVGGSVGPTGELFEAHG
jgi:methionine synthase I (cobalamin-dependent)